VLCNNDIKLTLVHKEKEWTTKQEFLALDNFELVQINDIELGRYSGDIVIDLDSVIEKLILENNTFLMFDRVSYKNKYLYGVKNYLDEIITSVYSVHDFLISRNIDTLYLRTTPHSILEWIFVHVAEYLEIRVLFCELTILPWRYKLVSGFRRNRVVVKRKNESGERTEYIESYLDQKSGTYDEGIPAYEKLKLLRNNGKIYSPLNDMKKWYKNPVFLVNKYRCYSKLQKLSSNMRIIEGKYAVFFLHYQPERTTVPEGYNYSSQLRAIFKLRSELPTEIALVIKEHPSIFTNKCDIRQRLPAFYEKIAMLGNTFIANIEENTFNLIDNACITATITGTVGIESFIRGTPVIFFGKSIMDQGYGVHIVEESVDDFRVFISKCIDGHFTKDQMKTELWEQISNQVVHSTSGLRRSASIDNYIANRDFGHIKVLSHIIQNEYELF